MTPRKEESSACRRPDLRERPADDALGNAGQVEVLRDPAEEEREAGAENERRVDVLRRGDHALLEQVPGLVGERRASVLEDLFDALALLPPPDDLVLALGVVGERGGERKAVRIGL